MIGAPPTPPPPPPPATAAAAAPVGVNGISGDCPCRCNAVAAVAAATAAAAGTLGRLEGAHLLAPSCQLFANIVLLPLLLSSPLSYVRRHDQKSKIDVIRRRQFIRRRQDDQHRLGLVCCHWRNEHSREGGQELRGT